VVDDGFGMTLTWNEYGLIGYKGDMELVWTLMLYWWKKHVVSMFRA